MDSSYIKEKSITSILVMALYLLSIFLHPYHAAEIHYIYPPAADNCHAQPCLTLGDYLSNASHYFTSNTSFFFLPGEHSLEGTLALHDVVNVTLRGADGRARIAVSSGGVILCSNSSGMSVSSMEILFHGDNLFKSALLFNNCHSFEIINTQFTGIVSKSESSRALSCDQSTGHVSNSSFSHGYAVEGGAIEIISSNVSFSAVSFTNNTAELFGGGVFASKYSTLTFNETVLFLNNSARLYGGGIAANYSTIIFSGNMWFVNNTADGGGGMALEASKLVLQSPVTVTF